MRTAINLAEARVNRGHSIRGLARHIDVPEQTIRRAERGERVTPENAFKIATFFDLKVTDIWPVEPSPSSSTETQAA